MGTCDFHCLILHQFYCLLRLSTTNDSKINNDTTNGSEDNNAYKDRTAPDQFGMI